MAEIELGTFLFFIAFPIVTFLFLIRQKTMTVTAFVLFLMVGIVGFIMCAGLALLMFGQYDVVISESVPQVSANTVEYNATGGLVSNSTTITPQHKITTPVLNDFHEIWGWVFFLFMVAYGLIYFLTLATGGVR